ncbi:precorrin-2 dehydrogenase/sirohydrochlorin ferrochelatase family protein [Polycladidibacter stylochi]|uniref:precorrin-2 dehydrogenase/sirohydrochlorin ferrochelatase family protein n=1 Tax=Polycladidibacter stylochi TaxID=1807766 RepID=UPI00082DB866|nr:NAD(P)-dependent oxidoreductase [Pseudovibrio stylochi]
MINTNMHNKLAHTDVKQAAPGARHRPVRIDKLSVLPVFFNLQGSTVLMVGASDAIQWKLELILAAGARVELVTGHVKTSKELQELVDNSPRARLYNRGWQENDFNGKAFALADLTEQGAAQAFYEAAKKNNLLVNIIDQPNCCDFQFGSIVNRGPCVVGISTSGAAPVLGQAIRQRLEAVLPLHLAKIARLAQSLRPMVMDRFSTSTKRRRFWHNFTSHIWTEKSSNSLLNASTTTALFKKLAESDAGAELISQPMAQYVHAPKAGADYITLRDLRVLQTADTIYYENGICHKILELARREAKRLPLSELTTPYAPMTVIISRE